MLRATVPEAAIHKNGQPLFWENEIRLAKNRLMPPPTFDAVPAQQFGQRQFRLLVAAPANPRHHFRPLRLGENVRHSMIRHNQPPTPTVARFHPACAKTSGHKAPDHCASLGYNSSSASLPASARRHASAANRPQHTRPATVRVFVAIRMQTGETDTPGYHARTNALCGSLLSDRFNASRNSQPAERRQFGIWNEFFIHPCFTRFTEACQEKSGKKYISSDRFALVRTSGIGNHTSPPPAFHCRI